MIIENKLKMPKGFKASGVSAGLKKSGKKDMSLIYSEKECVSAGTFTTNKVKAAPVVYDMSIVKSAKHGVVVNSGNANACTGKPGLDDTEKMAELVSTKLGGDKSSYYVCSTGVIGVPLNMSVIESGIDKLSSSLSSDDSALYEASEGILTTDTAKKCVYGEVVIGGKVVTIAGFAKGSGMIHPNMATMLSFILTDANISQDVLQKLLGESVEDTFNMISVDGDTSTNDTCLILANGETGNSILDENNPELNVFKEALEAVLGTLAKMITKDGEGAGRFIEVRVKGAKTKQDAKTLARSVVSSNLVKAAFFGSDANWGRILCAMGYSGAEFSPDGTDLFFSSDKGSIQVVKAGLPLAFSEEVAKEILLEEAVAVDCYLKDGDGEAIAWGCDLTYEYVRINGDYRS